MNRHKADIKMEESVCVRERYRVIACVCVNAEKTRKPSGIKSGSKILT